MDGDLQHPPELIPELVEKWKTGNYDIVYTVRKDDPRTGAFKRITSRLFYKFMNFMAGLDLVAGSADFRLLDKKVVHIIRSLNEDPIFFRGMIKWIGFRQCAIEYMPAERTWGKSKYSLKKMLNFAMEGITSFSTKPLYLSVYLGFIFSALALCYGIYIIIEKLVTNHNLVLGWPTIIAAITFIGGIQLMVMGIIGIYIGKAFFQLKQRPSYIIAEENFSNPLELEIK
jgi:dolichol-phosphate mannosyltransferase